MSKVNMSRSHCELTEWVLLTCGLGTLEEYSAKTTWVRYQTVMYIDEPS